MRELLAAFAQEEQELEFVASDLIMIKFIDNATGDQLDILGEYVGEDRNGRLDVPYRAAIKLRGKLNASNGEPETIIEYARQLTTAIDVTFVELYPGKVLLQIVSNNPVTPAILALIQKISPAGVAINIEFVQEGDIFGFDGEGVFPAAANIAGFGEEGVGNESVGGKFMEEL